MTHLVFLASLTLLYGCGKAEPREQDTTATPTTKPAPCGVGLDVPGSQVVGVVNGVSIPCSELFEFTKMTARSVEAEFREQVRGIHQQGLDELIDAKLLEAAAAEKKLSVQEYVATTLTIEPSTEAETKAFYDNAVAQGEPLPPYEQIVDELRTFINEQKQKSELGKFRFSLREKAALTINLPLLLPPKFDVNADGGVSKGAASARVTIVEFSDFECGFCAKAESTVHQVMADYGDQVRLVYRDFPLPGHADAPKAAEATHCAAKQAKYWQMHDLLFANQGALGIDALKGYAKTLELDPEKFAACLDSGETKPTVVASMEAAEKAGVTGTPAFFINGRMLSGAQSYERFKEIIDYELGNASKENTK